MSVSSCDRQIGHLIRPGHDDAPLHGTMAHDSAGPVTLAGLAAPQASAAVAFVLAGDLVSRAGLAGAIGAVGVVLPALVIIDASAKPSAFVLGATPRQLDAVDLRLAGMVIERAGEPVSVGCGAASFGHPLHALARLPAPLRAGDIVLAAGLGPAVAVAPGDALRLSLAGFDALTVTFGDIA